jgi:hypothetical protein
MNFKPSSLQAISSFRNPMSTGITFYPLFWLVLLENVRKRLVTMWTVMGYDNGELP